MFIKKLYQYNKALCVFFVSGALLFLFINFKWGVVATPMLQFGMYSSIFHVKDTQVVYKVEVNDNIIRNADVSLTNRDVLQVFPDYYEKQASVNEATYATIKKYISYTGLAGFMKKSNYQNDINDSMFVHWYKTKVESITGNPVHSLKLTRQNFVWNGDSLEPIGTASKLLEIGTQ